MNVVWLPAPIGGAILVGLLLFVLAPHCHAWRAGRCLRLGRDRQAAFHLEAAVKIWQARGRKLAAASAQANLARVRFLQGAKDRGMVLLEQAAENVLSLSDGKRSRELIWALVYAGQAANSAERYREALALGEKAESLAGGYLHGAEKLSGAIDAVLAVAHAGQGWFERAHDYFESALETYRLASGEDSSEVGAVLASMAAALAREERWREARETGIEAVEILDHADSARLPEALDALAELHTRRGRLAEAEGLRLSICHLWERLGGPESAALAREYELRAELLQSMQRVTEAGYLLSKAERIRRDLVSV